MECLGSTGVTSLAWWAMFQQVVFGGLATMSWWVEVVSTETSYRSTARCHFRQSVKSSQHYWFDQILPFVFRVGSWSCWNKKPDIKYQHSIEMRLTSLPSQLREVGQYFKPDSLGTHTMPVQATCGVLSGAVSALATNPLDVMRTRIQVL